MGKIQYLFPKITPSGSAYHPSITGLCGFDFACWAERVCIKNAGRIARHFTTLVKWCIDRLDDIGRAKIRFLMIEVKEICGIIYEEESVRYPPLAGIGYSIF